MREEALMESQVEIRASRPADREAIGVITRNSKAFSEQEVETVFELFDSYMKTPEAGYEFLSATADGRLAGYACFGQTALTDGAFDYYWLCTDPAFQKRGIGRRLCEEVENAARKRNGRLIVIWTSSTPEYEPATRLYLRIGYVLEARIRDFYKVGDDLLVFVKYL
jgi:ribosomal protein S18 acetylase RimI-like enzyme